MRIARLFVLLTLTAVAAYAAAPPGYTYLTVDYPAAFNTGVFGINNLGQSSGTYFDSNGIAHAFINDGGKFRSLDYPEANRTFGFGINDGGWIVGYYVDGVNAIHGFLHDGEKFSPIDYPKAKSTRALGLNKAGQIVGSFIDANGVSHGFLNEAGKFKLIDYPGSTRTEAYAINDSGWIVGYYADAKNEVHGFLNKAGAFSIIDAPNAHRTTPSGIDKSGHTAGNFIDGYGNHGFINDTGFVKLNYPRALSTFAFALNDSGQAVGQYIDEDSVAHGFMAVRAANQLPQISERVDPNGVVAGLPGTFLTVRGIGFVSGAVVLWNGTPRPTAFEDDAHLTVKIPPADIATPGTALLTVVNPGPSGGTSNVVSYTIAATAAP